MKRIQWFVKVAGVILLVTGLAKILSAVGENRILNRPDPIFEFLTNRQLMLFAGGIELAIAWAIYFKPDVRLSIFLVSWSTALFLIYRFGLWWIGYDGDCGCLGQLTDAIGLNDKLARNILMGTLGFLTIGSIYSLPKVFRKKELIAEHEIGAQGPE